MQASLTAAVPPFTIPQPFRRDGGRGYRTTCAMGSSSKASAISQTLSGGGGEVDGNDVGAGNSAFARSDGGHDAFGGRRVNSFSMAES
jgi:hypothetical protein